MIYMGKVTFQKPAQSWIRWVYWDRYHCGGKFIVDTGVSATRWCILTLITRYFFLTVQCVITVQCRLKIVVSLIAQITVSLVQLLGNFKIPKLQCYLCKKGIQYFFYHSKLTIIFTLQCHKCKQWSSCCSVTCLNIISLRQCNKAPFIFKLVKVRSPI